MDWVEKALKYVVFGALFAIPFIVFVVDSSQVFPFITGKNFLFRLLVEVGFLAWLGLIFFKEEYRPKKSLLLLSVGIFVAVMFVAAVFGIEPKQSFWSNFERMDGWVTLIHLLAYMVVLSSTLHTKELWRKFWNTTVIASFGVGLFAMAQLLREYLTETLGLPGDQGLALQAGARLLGKGDAVQRLCGNLQVDIAKARNLLGWVPSVSVDEGLRRAVGGCVT